MGYLWLEKVIHVVGAQLALVLVELVLQVLLELNLEAQKNEELEFELLVVKKEEEWREKEVELRL